MGRVVERRRKWKKFDDVNKEVETIEPLACCVIDSTVKNGVILSECSVSIVTSPHNTYINS